VPRLRAKLATDAAAGGMQNAEPEQLGDA